LTSSNLGVSVERIADAHPSRQRLDPLEEIVRDRRFYNQSARRVAAVPGIEEDSEYGEPDLSD
jgi:hypothetical protein